MPCFLPLVSIMFQMSVCHVYAWDRMEGLAQSLPQRNTSSKTAGHRTNLTNYMYNKQLAQFSFRALEIYSALYGVLI